MKKDRKIKAPSRCQGGTGIPVTAYYFSCLVFLHFSLDLRILILLIGTTSNDHILFLNSNIN